MKTKSMLYKAGVFLFIVLSAWGCHRKKLVFKENEQVLPTTFTSTASDSSSVASINWRLYFGDEQLASLIDSALANNQELNIVLQEILISQSDVLEKKGEYMPFVGAGLGTGTEKAGKFTRDGAVEHNLPIAQGRAFPILLSDFKLSATASWEVDIWRKLRNARDAAQLRYLAKTEVKNFLVTQLISEIAEAYYELMALDNLRLIIDQNIVIQQSALEKMKALKENAKANQLSVNRFEAQLLNTKNQRFAIQQKITETENRLYFLTGRYPNGIVRNSSQMMTMQVDSLKAGLPSQLLENRPDIRAVELEIAAAKLDVKVAKASFYPKLSLKSGIGFQAFNPVFLVNPESLIFNLAGDLIAPIINRKAIQAQFNRATSAQIQTIFKYQQTVLSAYTDVLNQLAKLDNYSQSVAMKNKEVELLKQSVDIANNLFQFAKADYIEVLLTQEEVLAAQMELVEIKLKEIHAKVGLYCALGGGWR
jgi:outer membrane protein, multidrug efflux system